MKNNVDFFFHFSDFTLNENLYPLKKHSSFYYIVRGVYYFTRSFVYSLIYGNYKYKEINSVKGKILFFCLSLNNRRALSSVMDKFDKQDYHLLSKPPFYEFPQTTSTYGLQLGELHQVRKWRVKHYQLCQNRDT